MSFNTTIFNTFLIITFLLGGLSKGREIFLYRWMPLITHILKIMVNEFLWNQFLILFPDVKSQNYFNRVQVWQKTIFSANITNLGKTRSTMITSSSLPFNSSLGYPVPACLPVEYGHRLLPPEINQSINQLVSLAKM